MARGDYKLLGNKGRGGKQPGSGRPPIEIDYAKVKKMAEVGCTYEECAHILGVSVSKLDKDERFVQVYTQNSALAKMSLRRVQLKAAQKGNVAAQIWLGKNWLKQRDTPAEEGGDDDVPPVRVEIVFKDARKQQQRANNDDEER